MGEEAPIINIEYFLAVAGVQYYYLYIFEYYWQYVYMY